MLEALGTRLKSFYDSGVENLSPPLASLHSTADTSAASASLGIDFSQKEVVSLSNVWKQGNWAIGSCRVIALLYFATRFVGHAKLAISEMKEPTGLRSARMKELFLSTVLLTESALSLCTWADRIKLVSLGKASFHTQVASYALGSLTHLFLTTTILKKSIEKNSIVEVLTEKDKKIDDYERNLVAFGAFFSGVSLLHNFSGLSEIWKGKSRAGDLFLRTTEIIMSSTGVGILCYNAFINHKINALRA